MHRVGRLISLSTVVAALAAGVWAIMATPAAVGLPAVSGAAQAAPRVTADPAAWAQVAAGDAHTCAVRINGTLWCWGLNTNGQLGLGNAGSGTDRYLPTLIADP